MVPKKRKSYTREFKIETVKLVTEGGASANQVADDMGIHVNTLYKWIRDLSAKPEEAFPGKGHMACSDAEMVRQLKRELDRVKMERDILKKAIESFRKTRADLSIYLPPPDGVSGLCPVPRIQSLKERLLCLATQA